MYFIILTLHSYIRWFVLGALLITIVLAYYGWIKKKNFSAFDNRLRHITEKIVQIQFIFGIILYCISPVVRTFFHDFKNTVHFRDIRFFGMEHGIMMILAVSLISIGSEKAKRKVIDQEKFKTIAIWFTIGLLVILSSIPWPFTGLVSRPYFRIF